jgi:hypothetical protein
MIEAELPELPAFLNERGRMLFRTLWNRTGPLPEAEIPGLIVICRALQRGTDADAELMRWLREYELTRETMRIKVNHERRTNKVDQT